MTFDNLLLDAFGIFFVVMVGRVTYDVIAQHAIANRDLAQLRARGPLIVPPGTTGILDDLERARDELAEARALLERCPAVIENLPWHGPVPADTANVLWADIRAFLER